MLTRMLTKIEFAANYYMLAGNHLSKQERERFFPKERVCANPRVVRPTAGALSVAAIRSIHLPLLQ